MTQRLHGSVGLVSDKFCLFSRMRKPQKEHLSQKQPKSSCISDLYSLDLTSRHEKKLFLRDMSFPIGGQVLYKNRQVEVSSSSENSQLEKVNILRKFPRYDDTLPQSVFLVEESFPMISKLLKNTLNCRIFLSTVNQNGKWTKTLPKI